MKFYIHLRNEIINGRLKRKPILHAFFTHFNNQPISILFDYCPGHPGSYYSRNGDPGDPPEPSEVELVHILHNGIEIEITDDEYEKISDQIIEYIENRIAESESKIDEQLLKDLEEEKAYANEMSF